MPVAYNTRSRGRNPRTPTTRVRNRRQITVPQSTDHTGDWIDQSDTETVIEQFSQMSTADQIQPSQSRVQQRLRNTGSNRNSNETGRQQASAMIRYDYGNDNNAIPHVYQPTGRIVGLVCDKYSGPDANITIEEWLRMFSLLTIDADSDRERLKALARHLSGEALSWMAEEVEPNWQTMTWDRCRTLMITRFSRQSTNPLIEATRRTLNKNETVTTYYNDMRRLIQQAGLKDANAVAMLTNGMPDSYRQLLGASRLKTPADWFEVALGIESSKSRRYGQPSNARENVVTGADDKRKNNRKKIGPKDDRTDTPPNKPCRYCLAAGKREFHWHSKCPLRQNRNGSDNQSGNQSRNNDSSSADVNTAMVKEYDYFDVKVNGIHFKAFLDSGSTVSIVSGHLARKLGLRPDPSKAIAIKQLVGTVYTIGSAHISVTIANKSKYLTLHVVDDSNHEALIGQDARRLFGLMPKAGPSTVTDYSCNAIIVTTNTVLDVQSEVSGIINRYDVFCRDDKDIGRIRNTKHEIRLKPGSAPVHSRFYRLAPKREAIMREHINGLLEKGLVRRSRSSYSSAMFLVPKKDGTFRPVVDYRALNAITIGEREPLPLIQDIIDRMAGATVFTTLDVAWSYWHLELSPDSAEKTAFITSFGLFEFTVLPFGLKNAASVCQQELRRVLYEFIGNGVETYLDDIVIYSKTREEHAITLDRVLQRLQAEGLRLRREKCRFFVESIEYLGHEISAGAVRPSQSKVKAIKEFPTPTNVKAVQGFVGLANYYRNFIPKFSEIARPLTQLSRKDIPFVWDLPQKEAFESLKHALCSSPVLAIYDPNRQIVLQTDASAKGLAGILMQPDADNKLHVIAYWSSKTSDTESKYSASALECLAVVKAIAHFRQYLESEHFEVWSDCSALRWLLEIKNPSSMLYRWSVSLGAYDFTVKYRPGVTNQAADALSRYPHCNVVDVDHFVTRQSEIAVYDIRKLKYRNGLAIVRYKGLDKLVVPSSLIPVVIREAHDGQNHPGLEKTVRIIAARYWWPNRDKDVSVYVKSCHVCQCVKPQSEPTLGTCRPIETPSQPNDVWTIDTIVIGRAADNTAAKYVITVVDHHSRFVWTNAVKRNTTEAVINVLSRLFDSVGKPKAILSDNGKNYTSNRYKSYLESKGVRPLLTAPYHPQANGLCERANGAIAKNIRLVLNDKPRLRWSSALSEATAAINNQPHSVTGFPPRYLQFGFVPDYVDTPDCTVEEARRLSTERSRSVQTSNKRKHDGKHRESAFEVGDYVKYRIPDNHPIRDKFTNSFIAPCVILEKKGVETYVIAHLDVNTGEEIRKITSHASLIRKYYRRADTIFSDENTIENTEEIAEKPKESVNSSNNYVNIAYTACTSLVNIDNIEKIENSVEIGSQTRKLATNRFPVSKLPITSFTDDSRSQTVDISESPVKIGKEMTKIAKVVKTSRILCVTPGYYKRTSFNTESYRKCNAITTTTTTTQLPIMSFLESFSRVKGMSIRDRIVTRAPSVTRYVPPRQIYAVYGCVSGDFCYVERAGNRDPPLSAPEEWPKIVVRFVFTLSSVAAAEEVIDRFEKAELPFVFAEIRSNEAFVWLLKPEDSAVWMATGLDGVRSVETAYYRWPDA